MSTSTLRAFLAAIGLSACSSAFAQVSYTSLDSTYTQDFNKADGWGTATNNTVAWVDGSTVTGWYAAVYNSTVPTTVAPATFRQTTYAYTTGISLYMFRRTEDLTQGALGSYSAVGTAGVSGTYYGVQIKNDTSSIITSFDFGYTGGQWYSYGNVGVQTLTVSYSTTATSLATGSWIAVADATFNSPRAPYSSSDVFLNGTTDANQVDLVPGTITGLNVGVGESIWIRWFDVNDTGVDNGLSIDDFHFSASGVSAVPEPSTWAAIFGVSALAVAVARRARRNRA